MRSTRGSVSTLLIDERLDQRAWAALVGRAHHQTDEVRGEAGRRRYPPGMRDVGPPRRPSRPRTSARSPSLMVAGSTSSRRGERRDPDAVINVIRRR